MKRGNKKGQFFLLAAVIISAIIIGFGYVTNEARINYEGDNFRDFTYEVKRESGALIDYEIYQNIQGGNLTRFIELLGNEYHDRDPNADDPSRAS